MVKVALLDAHGAAVQRTLLVHPSVAPNDPLLLERQVALQAEVTAGRRLMAPSLTKPAARAPVRRRHTTALLKTEHAAPPRAPASQVAEPGPNGNASVAPGPLIKADPESEPSTHHYYGYQLAKVKRVRALHFFLTTHVLLPASVALAEVPFDLWVLVPAMPVRLVLSLVPIGARDPDLDVFLPDGGRGAHVLAMPLAQTPERLQRALLRHLTAECHRVENLLECCLALHLALPGTPSQAPVAATTGTDASTLGCLMLLRSLLPQALLARHPPLRLCRAVRLRGAMAGSDLELLAPSQQEEDGPLDDVQVHDMAHPDGRYMFWAQLMSRRPAFLKVRTGVKLRRAVWLIEGPWTARVRVYGAAIAGDSACGDQARGRCASQWR
jgi:hypothetical protein